jgi:tetratricopeptide (TPR) repeat protein
MFDIQPVPDTIEELNMPKKTSSSSKTPKKQELQELDLEITFMEGITRRDPGYTDALQILGDDYTRRGRYADGLKVDQTLARLNPENALVHYNLACSYSLMEQLDQAVETLLKAIELGYRDFTWMTRDPDLKNLRASSEFERVRVLVRQLKTETK